MKPLAACFEIESCNYLDVSIARVTDRGTIEGEDRATYEMQLSVKIARPTR